MSICQLTLSLKKRRCAWPVRIQTNKTAILSKPCPLSRIRPAGCPHISRNPARPPRRPAPPFQPSDNIPSVPTASPCRPLSTIPCTPHLFGSAKPPPIRRLSRTPFPLSSSPRFPHSNKNLFALTASPQHPINPLFSPT